MDKINLRFINQAVSGKLIQGDLDFIIDEVSTDSRKVGENSVFFPLIGQNHDAHKFLDEVCDRGCRTVVLSDLPWAEKLAERDDINIVLVEDTLYALQDLAMHYLDNLNVKKISITGSVGKTTTKDLLYSALKNELKTGRNLGNLNNDIGVPLTIFTFDSSLEAVIIEMGMGYDGHLDRLSEIVKPDVAVITTIGSSHIEIFKTREGILKEKLKITGNFNNDDVLIINETCDLLDKETVKLITGNNLNVLSVGDGKKSDFTVKNICDLGHKGIKFVVAHSGEEQEIILPILGRHNAYNGALALAAANVVGVSLEEAAKGMSEPEMTKNRLEVKKTDKFTIIDDTYNASKESVCSALDTLISMPGERKIAILGDMFELGEDSVSSHEIVGNYAAESGINVLIAVGENAVDIAEAARTVSAGTKVYYFKTKDELYPLLEDLLVGDDVILVKASRGMALEKIVKKIQEIG